MYYIDKHIELSELIGQTFHFIYVGGRELVMNSTSDRTFKLYHPQECCENVTLEEVIGDLEDLIDSPILQAEQSTRALQDNEEAPRYRYKDDVSEWTFYKLATNKGYVTLRWYGSSNGYYGTQVDLIEVTDES